MRVYSPQWFKEAARHEERQTRGEADKSASYKEDAECCDTEGALWTLSNHRHTIGDHDDYGCSLRLIAPAALAFDSKQSQERRNCQALDQQTESDGAKRHSHEFSTAG